MAWLAWWRQENCLTRLAGLPERGGPVTLQRGEVPGPFRLRLQPYGVIRQGLGHALESLGDLVFGAGDGGGDVGEAPP